MTTLSTVELGVLGPLQVLRSGASVIIPGAKPRAILTMLGLYRGSVVSADALVELLWGDDPPRTAAKALQTHISSLRRALGEGVVVTQGAGWAVTGAGIDAGRYKLAAKMGRDAVAAGDTGQAVARFEEALTLWRGIPELPDGRRGLSEKTRWIEGHAALVEDRADALLATGRAAEIIGELEAAVAEAPLRERRWGQLMLALYRAGRQGEALGAFQRARSLLVDELGVDPGPDLRRLEAAIVAQDSALETPVAQYVSSVTRTVTFFLTDIEGSTAAWEADADAMAVALARHDELVEQVITSRGGRLIKTRGEGDATFSVFDRPSAAAAAAIELQDAILHEPWALSEAMRVRVALHTGEAELRDGDYFGRAVNRAARLRSLAAGGQILCSGATAELVIDSLSDDVALLDLGMRQLKNLARQEHVFELRLETSDDGAQRTTPAAPMERPGLPAVLVGPGPFVGRGSELTRLMSAWQAALLGGMRAVLIAGEPGVGKTRLAGEWSGQAYEQGAVVLYGRCDEDLGAPYQPFAEALRSLVPCLGASRLRGLRGVEALLPLVPALTDVVPDLAAPTRADPDTERYALFDAVGGLLEIASTNAPVVLILDDLHWAAKPTLLLLRHLLRFGERARVQIIGTYRSTDLDRSHPLAAMLADLHRDGTANRLALGGLDEDDVTAYVAEAGYDDEELARALATVTGGNPFFLIEALRHVDESGGRWDPSTLPQGVREAVSRRLSRLPVETNKALAAAAVVGSRFAVELVERVVDEDLVDAFDEACKAGIVVEEPGGRYRFNHALVRQSLLAELPSVRRMRLHQRIAATLENEPGAAEELLAELAHHYFECAWAGNAAKAVEYCRRAADQAMARLGYEGAADLYDHALHALEELDDELPDREDQAAELLIARCEALLAAGDATSAISAVSQLQATTSDSARLAAWAICFDGQLSMLVHPERLDEVEVAVGAAARKLAELDDAAGEAKAHTVRAGCLARLGRIGDCEIALDDALTAARRAGEHRRVNAVLAGAPLAALWGPNPVPRAGGRCLDVVRLLRITTDSPAVEATSTRCQAVLEAFRGRAAAARRMIDSARRTVTELGLRHALMEVEQFAGIVELVAAEPAAAEKHLRKAYNGFRRMGLDADTADTAALLGRACLALDRDDEANELCSESEQLAGNALKASIAWRTLRAQLLSRQGDHAGARRIAEEAVALAERTDILVDHGDACLSLATILRGAGDTAGARAAAVRALDLYERKGAAALAQAASRILGERSRVPATAEAEKPSGSFENACVRALRHFDAAVSSESWADFQRALAPTFSLESRRRIVGFPERLVEPDELTAQARRLSEDGAVIDRRVVVQIRGERVALTRVKVGTRSASLGAPQDELLHVVGLDGEGRIAMQVWFDVEDLDAAITELDAVHARFEAEDSQARNVEPDTACVRAIRRIEGAVHREAWDEVREQFAADGFMESRRKMVGFAQNDVASDYQSHLRLLETGDVQVNQVTAIAVRGERLAIIRMKLGTADVSPGAPYDEILQLVGIDEKGRIALQVSFDVEDIEAAMVELDALHARFDAEQPQVPRLENTASRVFETHLQHFADRDWDAMVRTLADDFCGDDRRHTVNAGVRHGREAEIENAKTVAELGGTNITCEAVAIRGERLVLARLVLTLSGSSEPFDYEFMDVIEIDGDDRMASQVRFDPDDIDAAFEELESRYLAREAAAHAQTWSVITACYAALSRHELPSTTGDFASIDHRRVAAFAPGELIPYLRAGWEVNRSTRTYAELAHRLDHRGAVVTHAAHLVSREGFEAEWRSIDIVAVRGDQISRAEIFDEADLDAALERFDQLSRQAPQLQNAASHVSELFQERFVVRDWDAMAQMVTDDVSFDDRRRVVNADLQIGRALFMENFRIAADLGAAQTLNAIAIRGDRLALSRARFSRGDGDPEEFALDLLHVIEIDVENRVAATVTFDVDDFDAAIAELDARYLADEAATHANTWSVITAGLDALNRNELPATTVDCVNIDHRRGAAFAAGDLVEYLRAGWVLNQDVRAYAEAVHRLTDLGAVYIHAEHGISQDGFQAEWRGVVLLTVVDDMVNRCELFDEADLDTALTRFDELSRPARRLENAASQLVERFLAYFLARDWDAMAESLADNLYMDDRRRVVNAGARRGRDAAIEDFRLATDLDVTNGTSDVIAIRGERLALTRVRYSTGDKQSAAFFADVLHLVDIDADLRITVLVAFDADDIDAALAELDARYLAGDAADHAHAWSALAGAFAAINRHELPRRTPDWVNVDHRRGAAFAPGDMTAYIHALWEDAPNITVYIEAVHRMTNLGALVTQVGRGTSHEGFEAEWQEIGLFVFEGDLLSHYELFDQVDLDAALAKFEELGRPASRLENTASQVDQRFWRYFAAPDWNSMAEILTDDFLLDDRRPALNAGIRQGRDTEIENLKVGADVSGGGNMTSDVIATRGERLALRRQRFSREDQGSEGFYNEMIGVVEINADERIVAHVVFDVNDIDAAFAELDARYLAGEAAPYARVWHIGMDALGELNRHELGPVIGQLTYADHRRIPFAQEDFGRAVTELWSLVPDARYRTTAVQALDAHGTVADFVIEGTDVHGNELRWPRVLLLSVRAGETRLDVYEEDDIATALAQFEELRPQTQQLENTATRIYERLLAYFAAREWDVFSQLLADDFFSDDRRRVVGVGVRHGREAHIADMRAIAEVGVENITSTVIATREARLVLTRVRFFGRDQRPEAFHTEVLEIVETNADERTLAVVTFDRDDIAAAFEELDARYLAGEAAAQSHTWSVITRAYAAFNRRELPPTTPDWVNVDHRRGTSFASGEMPALLDVAWNLTTDLSSSIEAVHRLDDLAAVVTNTSHETSQEGFAAEWRVITVVTVEGDMLSRCEVFDEADIDAALARFEELHPHAPRLENAASRVYERLWGRFMARDWEAVAETIAHDIVDDDRRRVLNAGLRCGRDAEVQNLHAVAELGVTNVTPNVIAVRGERLALCRVRLSTRDQEPGAFTSEVLRIVEVDAEERIVFVVLFDVDDIEAAIEELDARYLAGEAADHAQTWSAIAGAYARLNRRELPATTTDWVNVDHRRVTAFAPGDAIPFLRATWDDMPDLAVHIETVHRLTELGAAYTLAGRGTSQEGFDAEWRIIFVHTVEGDRISHCEVFDEADLVAALARFEELRPQPPRLENAASQVNQRFWSHFAARDFDAMAELLAEDISTDDRRRVVNAGVQHGRDVEIANMRALAEVGANIALTVMATRGERLALTRLCSSNDGLRHGEFGVELLTVIEINPDNEIATGVLFEADDIDAAFEELDARYLAGEAAAHAHTWSVIANIFAALKWHELPATTPDWINIDRRRLASIGSGQLIPSLRATWDLAPDFTIRIETVHRLTDLGSAFTYAGRGTSHDGVAVEWLEIALVTLRGDAINHCELFDETDLDAALARFDELNREPPH